MRKKLKNFPKQIYKNKIFTELEVILDSAFDGIWICDNEGKVNYINKASEKLNNLKSNKVLNRYMNELVEEGLIDRSVSMEVLKTHQAVTFMQTLPNGKRILSTGSPVFDNDNKLSLVIVNERDITELGSWRRFFASA